VKFLCPVQLGVRTASQVNKSLSFQYSYFNLHALVANLKSTVIVMLLFPKRISSKFRRIAFLIRRCCFCCLSNSSASRSVSNSVSGLAGTFFFCTCKINKGGDKGLHKRKSLVQTVQERQFRQTHVVQSSQMVLFSSSLNGGWCRAVIREVILNRFGFSDYYLHDGSRQRDMTTAVLLERVLIF